MGWLPSLGTVTLANARGELALGPRDGVQATLAAQWTEAAGLQPRDSTLQWRRLVVNRPDAVLRVSPGLSFPTGTAARIADLVTQSSYSLDPRLSAEAAVGATWLLAGRADATVPVYRGADGVRQGALLGADAAIARRIGGHAVVALGIGLASQLDDDSGAVGFAGLAPLLAGVWNARPRFALNASMRRTVWSTNDLEPFMGTLGISLVTGSSEGE